MALSRYRDIGRPGEDWPSWIRALRWSSGVYVIRRISDGATVYVGESHSDRLASTIQRHFQRWTGYTAGTTYQRGGKYEIAIEETSAKQAPDRQYDLIERLAPEDNSYGQRELPSGDDDADDMSDIPF